MPFDPDADTIRTDRCEKGVTSMIQIGFCDDNALELERIQRLLHNCHPFEEQYEISVFANGQDLLDSPCRPFDLLFLDVQMPGMDGYETARRIRETDLHTVLVFLTGVAAPTVEVFQVTPFRYLMKQMDDATICRELEAIFAEVTRKTRFLTIRSGNDLVRLNVASILYLTIAGREVELVTDQGRQTVRAKMAQLYSQLAPHGFGYAHKSYLVNFNRILSVTGSSVIMDNGDILPISQPKSKSFKQEFIRFAGMKL